LLGFLIELNVPQDPPKSTDARAHTDTLHTPFSPQGWDTIDANSPPAHTYNIQSFPVPQSVDEMAKFNIDLFNQPSTNDKVPFQEAFLDFNTLPVVLGELAPESVVHADPWPMTDPVWHHDTDFTKSINTYNTMPFIHQEDSMDMKYVSVTPQEVESNLIVINEENGSFPAPVPSRSALSVDVSREAWPADLISTPEVLSVVEQLETEKCPLLHSVRLYFEFLLYILV
ncbi:jg236, partial [Pararge aegeria aegeria]